MVTLKKLILIGLTEDQIRIEDDGASHVPVSTDNGNVGRNGNGVRSWSENDGAIPEAPMQCNTIHKNFFKSMYPFPIIV